MKQGKRGVNIESKVVLLDFNNHNESTQNHQQQQNLTSEGNLEEEKLHLVEPDTQEGEISDCAEDLVKTRETTQDSNLDASGPVREPTSNRRSRPIRPPAWLNDYRVLVSILKGRNQ